jgi:hypothetical protein
VLTSYPLQDHGLQAAIFELQTLLKRFANRQSMDIIFDTVNALIDDVNKDEELKEWFKSLNTYIR